MTVKKCVAGQNIKSELLMPVLVILGPRSTLVKLANDMSSVSLYFVAQTQDSLDDLLVNVKLITGDDLEHSHGFEHV